MKTLLFSLLLVGCSANLPAPMKEGKCRPSVYTDGTVTAYQCSYKEADWLCEGEKVFATYSFSCRRQILGAAR